MNNVQLMPAVLISELDWSLEMLHKEAMAKNSMLMSYLRGRADGILFCAFRASLINRDAYELIHSVIASFSEYGWTHEQRH